MKTGIVIQARLGSSRLPAKVLLMLPDGMNVLQTIALRCSFVRNADCVIVAYPEQDVAIGDTIKKLKRSACGIGSYGPDLSNLHCFPSKLPESDVLSRYWSVARAFDLDRIVRITADCPRIQPDVVAQLIELQGTTFADYASNVYPDRTYPKGWDCEVFTRDLLEEVVAQDDLTDADREHVTGAMQRIGPHRLATLRSDGEYDNWPSCTLDTIEDFRRLWGMEW